MKLEPHYVEKPWGRTRLPAMFDPPSGRRIGEVWFAGAPHDAPLLAKYLFTSERLSIQVHPDDAQASERGLTRGKSECWYVLDAEPGATLGLGLKHAVAREELRAAALDGSIEQLIDWRPVRAGDFVSVTAGTIHAIGGGITLLEFQQNSDVTYRLYDYGRPRELHLDDGIAVAVPAPLEAAIEHVGGEARTLVDGPHFALVSTSGDALADRQRWVMPIAGEACSRGAVARAGECLLVEAGERVEAADARLLIGAMAEPS
jgi:mannose-6-phosphate isomerase